MEFNKTVHQEDEHGDPLRNDDGTIRLKTNWKKVAKDRQGRSFNARIHEADGDTPVLDSSGFLKVRRRDSSSKKQDLGRLSAFVDEHREDGYAYYVANDEGGRYSQMVANDWEPVTNKEGAAKIDVGQARGPSTTGVLFRKPIEWHEKDMAARTEERNLNLKDKTSPKEEYGQYEAEASSPLR